MQENNTPQKPKKNILETLTPAILVVTIGLAFAVGVLWQKVQNLEGGGAKTTATTTTAGTQTQEQPKVSLDTVKALFDKDLIKFGDKKKKLLIVEVADPSCPYCHIAGGLNPELSAQVDARFKYVSDGGTYQPPVPEIKKLVDQGKASYIYIYTPGHGNGEMGTKAMYCGYEKGKFWQVHDLLMTNKAYDFLNNTIKNDKAKSQELADYLKSAMSPVDMKACLDSGKYDDRLASDSALAKSLGLTGTPGYILNDQLFKGAYGWAEMKAVADSALK